MRKLIREDNIEDIPKLPELAKTLDVSTRTVRRLLIKEGSSYQQLKDEIRRDLAIAYLSEPETSISEAAQRMGFTELSAFHRSFKKWTGITPGEFQKRNELTDSEASN
ncbi:MAG: helix-turn-helix domain-containing protein [Endozoicomonas sp.]|uniref:helix-turn-helix domain-containing protein n=1 Tax=Endozoicomonas sp. TaxID=1892382 RepID=UPI003D9B2CD7